MFKLLLAGLLAATVTAEDFTNPIALKAPDPWMVYYDGYYYLTATTWADNIGIRKSKTIEGLKAAENTIVYTFNGHTAWAPEIHQVDNKWYLYYTACDPGTEDYGCHRNRVAESQGSDPMGPYTHKADLYDPDDQMFELDPSLIKINNKYYLIASYIPGIQNLYIRELTNPYTMAAGKKHMLATATYDWEKQGGTVLEGPEPLYHGNKTFIVYSASYCATPDYKLGLLEYLGGDPLNMASWKKHSTPVFQRSDAHKVYGPGHNGFFKSPDGKEDWIIYHANDSPSAGCDMNRSSRAQKFTWGSDGLPNFGVPEQDGTKLVVPAGQ